MTETEVSVGASAFGFGGSLSFKRKKDENLSDKDKLAIISGVLKSEDDLINNFVADVHSLEFAYLHGSPDEKIKIKHLIDRLHYEMGMIKETIEYDFIREQMDLYDDNRDEKDRVTLTDFGFKSSEKFSNYLLETSKLSVKKKTNFKTHQALIQVSLTILMDLTRIIKQQCYNSRTKTSNSQILLTSDEKNIIKAVMEEVKFHIFGRELDKYGKEVPYTKDVKEWHVAYIRKYIYYIVSIMSAFVFRNGKIPPVILNHQKFIDTDGYVIESDKREDRYEEIISNEKLSVSESKTMVIWANALTDITFLIKSAEKNNKGRFSYAFSNTLSHEERKNMAFCIFDMLDNLCGMLKGCVRVVDTGDLHRLSRMGSSHSIEENPKYDSIRKELIGSHSISE